MTMVVVTHEVGFAREVADRIVLMDSGVLVEEAEPKEFFQNPKEERTRKFLSQIFSLIRKKPRTVTETQLSNH
jgi:general L-amino acid transport system ATP-binding protein